jgi:cell division protein FtsB
MKTPIQDVGSDNGRLSPGAINLQKFENWIKDRDAANDWADYIRGGKLNRTEVAAECGFGTPAFRQNPSIAQALQALEARLQDAGVTNGASVPSNETTDAATIQAADLRILSSKASAERRVKAVEEQNAALKAENRDLREQLKRYKFLDEHLSTTGRLLHA